LTDAARPLAGLAPSTVRTETRSAELRQRLENRDLATAVITIPAAARSAS
jgi:hypothetical protein